MWIDPYVTPRNHVATCRASTALVAGVRRCMMSCRAAGGGAKTTGQDMRRAFGATLVLLAFLSLPGRVTAEDRIAIIDTAWDTRPYLDQLQARGVTVIGRYYARCSQAAMGLTEKRLIDQGLPDDPGSEVAQILSRGMAILSIYQYFNNSPAKFEGRSRAGDILPDAACRPTLQARGVSEEARLDAEAAVRQARRMGQPTGSAIYFGVDFALDARDGETRQRMVTYFQVVEEILSAEGYRLGAYGSGLAQTILRAARTRDGQRPLIAFSWLSASRAFPGISAVHRSGEWHLFQNQVNREWFGAPSGDGTCSPGLPIDTNVQNARHADDVGFWGADGGYHVPPRRTAAIEGARRFACNGDAIIRRTQASGVSDRMRRHTCAGGRYDARPDRIDFANAVRLGAAHGELVEVDVDDDGVFDGWTWVGNLTADFGAKPDWIFERRARRNATCR